MRARGPLASLMIAAAVVPAWAQGSAPPRLVSALVPPAPPTVQSGGIAAFDVAVDESGAVAAVDTVQDFAPYGEMMAGALRGWRFEPARAEGRPARSRVLVLGFFRPPELAVIAPERPRYKDADAPAELPWPTSVTVPPYPPNTLGSGVVVLEVDVSDEGRVMGTRVLTPGSPFEGAATGAARGWAFRPASRNGRAAASRAFFIFSFVGTTP